MDCATSSGLQTVLQSDREHLQFVFRTTHGWTWANGRMLASTVTGLVPIVIGEIIGLSRFPASVARVAQQKAAYL